jgi:hypothetical protein
VKYSSYVQYQSDFLLNQLESWEILDIEYYTMIVHRMTDFLSRVQSYLNGESDTTLSQEDLDLIEYEELRNYVNNVR